MISKELIYKEMTKTVEARGCFITDVSISRDNDIVIAIESENGIVEMDDCIAVNDSFLSIFDQEKEDYSLTVTSAGLDQPFKILKQYIKAVGSKVETLTRDGKKLVGTLESADEKGFTLAYEVKEAVPGKKKKELVRHVDTFAYEDVNSVTPHIEIEKNIKTITVMEEEKLDLKAAFALFKDEKHIDRPVMMGVLKDVFMTQLAKTFGSADNFDVIINVDKGDCEIYQNLEVVENVENPNTQIALAEVNKNGDDYELGETFTRKVELKDFGRRGILNIRQNLQGRIMDIEKANLYNKYTDKIGEIFTGEIYQTWAKEVLILDEDGNELRLPKSEQIPGEHFKKNDTVRAIIKSVEMKNNTTPYIVLSRTSNEFLKKLFEQEVPEIYDGLITIKKVVRIPGERAKVAVESYDDRIDPIGACIGVKGARIIGIVRELRNENIDVLQWTNNTQLLIQRALNPAKISSIDMGTDENDKIKVFMLPDEVKKGIGKGGCNIKLAGMLVDREIEVWREVPKEDEAEDDEDVLLTEFSNEIDPWVIERLQSIGCDTAKSVLALDPEDIAKRADLEDETVEDVMNILRAEFEEE